MADHAHSGDPREHPELGASEATIADLDARREALLAERSQETEEAFWEAVMRLPAWHFITGAPEEAGETSVLTFSGDDERAILPVYSTRERAEAAAAQITEAEEPGGAGVATLPTREALGHVCTMHEGVDGALFDFVQHRQEGFGTRITSLPALYDHFIGPAPVSGLFHLAQQINREPHEQLFRAAYRSIAAHGVMYVMLTDDGSVALMKDGDNVFFPAFAEHASAERVSAGTPGSRVEAIATAQLLEVEEVCREQLGDEFFGVVINPDTGPITIRPDWMREALEEVGDGAA